MAILLESLYNFAKNHGFEAVILEDTIKVWDCDGEIVTDSLLELMIWAGY